jgi:predicted metal-dependent hydrolase
VFERRIWDRLRDFERPGFHPNDHDNTELVAYWRAELFGEDGVLTDRLAGAGAAA